MVTIIGPGVEALVGVIPILVNLSPARGRST